MFAHIFTFAFAKHKEKRGSLRLGRDMAVALIISVAVKLQCWNATVALAVCQWTGFKMM